MAKEDGRLEDVEYEDYPPSPPRPKSQSTPVLKTPAPKTPSPKTPSSKTLSTYSSDRLKKIGAACKDRLPPASAVQAMFQYELKRDTENEELFRGLMYKVGQQEASAAADQERMQSLEQRLVKLEKQAVHDRVAAQTLLLKDHDDKLKVCTDRIDTLKGKLAKVESQLATVQKQATDNATSIATLETDKTAVPEPDPAINTIKQEIDVLFTDRDGIIVMVKDAKTHLDRLEGNLRALTLQRGPD